MNIFNNKWLAFIGVGLLSHPTWAYPDLTWQLKYEEDFTKPLSLPDIQKMAWKKDPLGAQSYWHIDQFDDDGEAFKVMGGQDFIKAISTFHIYRKQMSFGQDNWLTLEIAALDKDLDGKPDTEPSIKQIKENNSYALKLSEPNYASGIILRASKPLPEYYRIEVKMKDINFGGKNMGESNGYRASNHCRTSYPYTFWGMKKDKKPCEYLDVINENGFYYLAILDHAHPAPHGNIGIHYRRKVVMDSYNSNAGWSQHYGICNPQTGQIYSVKESQYPAINAIFIRGDEFKPDNNFIGNGYIYKTSCGTFNNNDKFGDKQQFKDILSTVEINPKKSYTFAIERDHLGYTIEMQGDFARAGKQKLRYHHDFIENGIPIWHYNQTKNEYQGQFNKDLTHTGYAGKYISKDIWPKGSFYPDNFIIGDPHTNYYEGDVLIESIKLYVLDEAK